MGKKLKIYSDEERLMGFIECSSMAYLINGNVCLKLHKPLPDGSDVVETKMDTDYGYYVHSFGKFNHYEGNHIEDSGSDVVQFMIQNQLRHGKD